MKLHRDLINTTFSGDILNKAEQLGMNTLDYNKMYLLVKTGEKNPSPYGYTDGEIIMGYPYLIGNKNEVALFIAGHDEWFKTSAIIKMNDDLTFETLNSYYKLTPNSFMVG